jgi:hypothetical protein
MKAPGLRVHASSGVPLVGARLSPPTIKVSAWAGTPTASVNLKIITAEEPPAEEEPPIPEDVHKRAAALARALFELDE